MINLKEHKETKKKPLSIHGDIQNPAGHRHKQAALADSIRAEVWIRCFQAVPANLYHPVILWTHFLIIKKWDLLQKDWLLSVFKLSLVNYLQPHSKDGSQFTTGRWLGIEGKQHMGMWALVRGGRRPGQWCSVVETNPVVDKHQHSDSRIRPQCKDHFLTFPKY